MEEIPGKKAGSVVYVYDGHGFHIDKRGANEIYRCATRSTTQCPAAATVCNGIVDLYTPHGGRYHRSNPTMIEESRMKQKMLEKCRDTNETLKSIFDEVCRGNPAVAVNLSFTTLKSALERERAKRHDAIPHSLKDLADALDDYAPTRSIYRGFAKAGDDVALLFASDEMIHVLNSANEIYVDGTFKVTPNDPPVMQMYSVHVRIMDTGLPAVYILTTCRTTDLYKAIFERITELAPGLKDSLTFVMGDYERAAMSAIRTVFPNASLHGCWFHFNQAVRRSWKRLGLHSAPTAVLKRVMALPLAPANRFDEGLEIIGRMADEISDEHRGILEFMRYMRRQWSPLASVVSVHGCSSRTNNLVESFHQAAKKKLGGLHPNIWSFLEHLTELITDQTINLARLNSGMRVRRLRPLRSIQHDTVILEAQDNLRLGSFTLEDFLLRCSTRTEDSVDVADMFNAAELPEQSQQEELQPLVDVAWMAVGDPSTIHEGSDVRGRRGRASRRRARAHPISSGNERVVQGVSRGSGVDFPAEGGPVTIRGRTRGRGRARGRGRGRGRGLSSETQAGPTDNHYVSPAASPSRESIPAQDGAIDDESDYRIPEDDFEVFPEPVEPLPYHPVAPITQSAIDEMNAAGCAICKIKDATHAVIPCGHRCVCEDCGAHLKNAENKRCPICRDDYWVIIRIRDT